MNVIKISELNPLNIVLAEDFFPLVESSSLTTYRVDITTLNNWMAVSGSSLSASYAPFSQAFQSSASWASQSLSSSYALISGNALKAYVATQSLYATQSLFATQSLYATQSKFATSASWASSSISASKAISASYAPSAPAISASYALSASYPPFNNGDTVPIGAIMPFAGDTLPNNWLECNGAAVLTASYSELYSAISSSNVSASYGYLCDSFGNRNGVGPYFKLPDLRGEFVRGWDDSRGIDIARTNKSFQFDGVGAHTHGVYGGSAGSFQSGGSYGASNGNNGNPSVGITGPVTNGAVETRPRNVAMIYCIKYSNAINLANLSSVTLAGDVVGTYNATNVVKIQGVSVDTAVPLNTQVLTFNSIAGKWQAADAQTGNDSVYPHISYIGFTASHDDHLNIDLSGFKNRDNQSDGLAAGYSNTSPFITHELTWDSASLGLYVVKASGSLTQYVPVAAVQNCTMFVDNRGGGPFRWTMTGSFVVKFALSPTVTRTYTYAIPSSITNYAGNTYKIISTRAKLGVNAILDSDALYAGTITNMFPSFVIS